MARVTHAAPHLPIAEVKNRVRTDPRAMSRQRWLIIYNALVEPRSAVEIARHCGVSKATVHTVISRYNRLGVTAIETPGKGGRRRQYLTLEEEKGFLAPFFAQAECGEIATVGQIWRAFEQRIGHEVDDSTIYRLLHCHGWRKVMPRPRHPKSDLETQEQFKKTFQRWWKRQLPRKRQAARSLSIRRNFHRPNTAQPLCSDCQYRTRSHVTYPGRCPARPSTNRERHLSAHPAIAITRIPAKIKIAPMSRSRPKSSPSQRQPMKAASTMLISRIAPA